MGRWHEQERGGKTGLGGEVAEALEVRCLFRLGREIDFGVSVLEKELVLFIVVADADEGFKKGVGQQMKEAEKNCPNMKCDIHISVIFPENLLLLYCHGAFIGQSVLETTEDPSIHCNSIFVCSSWHVRPRKFEVL